MKKSYDFSRARQNPLCEAPEVAGDGWARSGDDRVLQDLSDETGIAYQTVINLYLRGCAANRKKLSMFWRISSDEGAASQETSPSG